MDKIAFDELMWGKHVWNIMAYVIAIVTIQPAWSTEPDHACGVLRKTSYWECLGFWTQIIEASIQIGQIVCPQVTGNGADK